MLRSLPIAVPPYSSANATPIRLGAPHLLRQGHRKLVSVVDLGGARRDLILRELLHRVAQSGHVFTMIKS
jgi:hypothetical protein